MLRTWFHTNTLWYSFFLIASVKSSWPHWKTCSYWPPRVLRSSGQMVRQFNILAVIEVSFILYLFGLGRLAWLLIWLFVWGLNSWTLLIVRPCDLIELYIVVFCCCIEGVILLRLLLSLKMKSTANLFILPRIVFNCCPATRQLYQSAASVLLDLGTNVSLNVFKDSVDSCGTFRPRLNLIRWY